MSCVSHVLVILLCLTSVYAVNNRKKRKHSSFHIGVDIADIDPVDRSMEQWQSLPTESIRLACDEAHLVSSGSRDTLVNSLWCFYHPSPPPIYADIQSPSTTSNNNADVITLLNSTSTRRRTLNNPPPHTDTYLTNNNTNINETLAQIQDMQRQLSSALNEVLPQLRQPDTRNSNNLDTVVPASTTIDNFPSSGINFNSVGQQQSTAIPHPGHSYVG